MASKLYKLAIWYIGKCNEKWNKRKFEGELKALDRLTFKMFGKYVLFYGADAEWQKFSRYEVLDNAIQKLAKYENDETEIRAKAIDEFVNALINYQSQDEEYKSFSDVCYEIAEQLKGGAE